MNKILSFCAVFLMAGMVSEAQTTPLPYIANFETVAPWQVIRKGDVGFYTWTIDNGSPYSGKSLYHGYPVGGSTVTDDWFISPAFSFTSGGKIDSVRHNFSGFGIPQAGDTVAVYLLQGNSDPALAVKTLLYDFRGTNYVADHQWYLTKNIAIPPTSGTSYIAFRYHTVANWLDVRFDNLGISGTVNNVKQVYTAGKDFVVAPNPVVNSLSIRTQTAFKWTRIYDAAGKMVYNNYFEPSVDMSMLPAGCYFLELLDANYQKGCLSIIKQ